MDPKRILSIIFAILFGLSFIVAVISFSGVFIGFLVNAVQGSDRNSAIAKYNQAVNDFTNMAVPNLKLAQLAQIASPTPIPFVSNTVVVDPVVGTGGDAIQKYTPFVWWVGNTTLYPSTPIDPTTFFSIQISVNGVSQPASQIYQFYYNNVTGVSAGDCTNNKGRPQPNNVCQYVYALQSVCLRFDSVQKLLRFGCFGDFVMGKGSIGQYSKIDGGLSAYSAVNTNVTIRDATDPALVYYDMTSGTGNFPAYGWSANTIGLFILSIVFIALGAVMLAALVAQAVQLWVTRKVY
jgi:hypothetical protein